MANGETLSHSDTLPESDKTNFDDGWFADSKHWEDVKADLDVHYPPRLPEVEVKSEYQKIADKIHTPVQRRGSDGYFNLYTTDDSDHLVWLAQYLATDLFKKYTEGKLTRDERDELLADGLAIVAEYKKRGQLRRPISDYDVVVQPSDDELDVRDVKERAAGESLD